MKRKQENHNDQQTEGGVDVWDGQEAVRAPSAVLDACGRRSLGDADATADATHLSRRMTSR
jgi:hypothetical protein